MTSQGTLELSLHDVPVPTPGANEVFVRVEASPINPSTSALVLAGADMTTATVAGTPERPTVTASSGAGALEGFSARIDKPLPVGTEGASSVVATGPSPAAQALLEGGSGSRAARCTRSTEWLMLPRVSSCPGATARDGASSFVNPMTARGMVETMRRDGHSGLVHTAAASNLGQMLVKLCREDGIPLVNIVRKPEQEELLRSLGAIHVCNSGSLSFATELVRRTCPAGQTRPRDAASDTGFRCRRPCRAWSMVTPILMSIGSVRFAGDAHIHEQTAPQFASEATRSGSDQPM